MNRDDMERFFNVVMAEIAQCVAYHLEDVGYAQLYNILGDGAV